jgi:hypothetical protein
MTPDNRDALEVDALRTDRYLEALLAAQERRASDSPSDSRLDPAVRAAATQLADQLVPVHPSFRFEERLAARLAEAARAMRLAPAAGGETVPIPFPYAGGLDPLDPLDPLGPLDGVDPRVIRPYLIGGALTSAALSLAGAAWVAWRRTHGPRPSPMARAVRAARESRLGRRRS